MKKMIVIINLLLLIFFLSCTRNEEITIIDKYELNLIDSFSISYQLGHASVNINNGYIFLFDTQAENIVLYDSIGNLIFNIDVSGESPGKGYSICQNGAFVKDKIVYIIYSIPPKISKYNLNGEFIEDIKFFISRVTITSNINKDCFVVNYTAIKGRKYVILDENNIENSISEFIVTSDINNWKYQEYFKQNPSKEGLGLFNFSVNDTLIFIPDQYSGLIQIFSINGDIVDKVEIVNDYNPPPFVEVKRLNKIINMPIPELAIFPPIFYDSLIIVRVSDKYINDWKKAKNVWLSINDPEIEKYKDFLYIYNNKFKLLDTVELPIVDIGLIFSSNDLIYLANKVHEEDSSYLIIYRYQLEEIDN